MQRTILVAGATGQVGRCVAELLAEQGHPLRLLTREPSRAPRLPNAQAVQGDYSDPAEAESYAIQSAFDGGVRRDQCSSPTLHSASANVVT